MKTYRMETGAQGCPANTERMLGMFPDAVRHPHAKTPGVWKASGLRKIVVTLRAIYVTSPRPMGMDWSAA